MGDQHGPEAGATTPLEAAHTPNFDKVASRGEFGLIHTIPEGYPPGSDVGNLSLFGYAPQLYYTGRSPLEAAAMGIKLGADDIAFRMNLVTLRATNTAGEEVMDDFAGGHIDSESAAQLVQALSDALGDESFQFYSGVSYRHLMVWRKGLQAMETTPPHDISDEVIDPYQPKGEGADQLRRIMQASRAILAGHPANKKRVAAGHKPVSQAWLWGQGKAPTMPTFMDLYQLNGAVISAVDLVRGVAVYAGFDIIHVPGATGYIDTDYKAKGEYALKTLGSHDLVFVHIEAPDEAGHMGSREEKIKAIESIDEKIVGPLLEKLTAMGPFKLLITSDHATPVALKTHSYDPVPYAMATGEQLLARGGNTEGSTDGKSWKYGEADAARSGISISDGHTVVEKLLAL